MADDTGSRAGPVLKAKRKLFVLGPSKRMVDAPRGSEISLLPPPGVPPLLVVPRVAPGAPRPAQVRCSKLCVRGHGLRLL
jgi:hypothetical protein